MLSLSYACCAGLPPPAPPALKQETVHTLQFGAPLPARVLPPTAARRPVNPNNYNAMATPVELTAALPLPVAVSRSAAAHVEGAKVVRAHFLKKEVHNDDNVQVAPYQALPVSGPVITHHKSTALPVLEPNEHGANAEVCVCPVFGGKAADGAHTEGGGRS